MVDITLLIVANRRDNAKARIAARQGKPAARRGQDATQASGDLFQYLMSQAHIPEFQVRWRWRKNSVAIWDNRSTQHYAVADYWPHYRVNQRVTFDTPSTQ